GRAESEPRVGDFQDLVLGVRVLSGDANTFLGGPDRDVVVRDVCRQRYQRAVVVRERGQQGGFARPAVAADSSPEIEVPAGLDPDLGLPDAEGTAAGHSPRLGPIPRTEVLDG